MFAIPGILGLILFIYIRPQEFVQRLQEVKFLYVFFACAIAGLILDLKLRISRPAASPQLPWVVAFFVWSIISLSLKAPQALSTGVLELSLTFIIFFVISQGVQTLKGVRHVVHLLIVLVCLLLWIGIHQGTQPKQCLETYDDQGDLTEGTPDGRPCELATECYRGDPAPGAEYMCERVGLAGTHTVGLRIRYRGVLQDANELALTLSLGLALALGLLLQVRTSNRRRLLKIGVLGMLVAVLIAVKMSQSRGGQLVFMLVVGVFGVYRFRWKGVFAGVLLAIPVIIKLLSSDRKDALSSTEERYEAWSAGFDFFISSPVLGIGPGQFVENHYLTAHNAYVLMAAELGLVGMTIWMCLYYLSVKIALSAFFRYRNRPEAQVARAWGLGLGAAMLAMSAGIFFLSFSYHQVLWIHLGLIGAFYNGVRKHDAEFKVKLNLWEFLAIAAACPAFMLVLRIFLVAKGF